MHGFDFRVPGKLPAHHAAVSFDPRARRQRRIDQLHARHDFEPLRILLRVEHHRRHISGRGGDIDFCGDVNLSHTSL